MIQKTDNDNVNAYLKKPPHWLVGNGIALIFCLVIVISVTSTFVEVSKSHKVSLLLGECIPVLPIHVEESYYLSEVLLLPGDSVALGEPILKVTRVASGMELKAFKATLSENLQKDRNTFSELFDDQIPVYDSLILARADGTFLFDSLRSDFFIVPHQNIIHGNIEEVEQLRPFFPVGEELLLRLDTGERVVSTVTNASAEEGLHLSFSMPRPLSLIEVKTRRLNAHLVFKQSLWFSIIERL